ncbi:thrombospondin type 3 repeat-containing protein [Porticoccaceae bacterium]|nr:thrombospondin type 3 repeat-containing protein [Porticoccaceae bacterium]
MALALRAGASWSKTAICVVTILTSSSVSFAETAPNSLQQDMVEFSDSLVAMDIDGNGESDATISRDPIVRDFDPFLQQTQGKVSKINSELTTLRNYQISESVDTDGDGLSDDEDPYPSDGTRPFYGDLISSDTAQTVSWDNTQFQFTIQNDSSFDISLSEFIVFNGSGVQIAYTNDQSLLGGDGLLSVDEVTGLTFYLYDVFVGPIDLVYYYINPEDQTGETITARFNTDTSQVFGSYALDTDGDGEDNNTDPDDDGDGVLDIYDAFPLDSNETQDADNDGTGDNADVFPNDPSETQDSDLDGIGDNSDWAPNDGSEWSDTDDDGVGDNADIFPNDATETADSDGDGVGDNTDSFPFDATETRDTDGDGVGNNADTDDDGDGVSDIQDVFPLKNTETKDSDGDGIGDNDEERAELIASDILSQKMISYAGSVAASFIDDIEDDYAGESDDWTIARGESVNLSIRCDNGGGYDATVTRSDWTVLTISMSIENCIDQNFMTTNGSATVTYDDDLWDQPTPREEHPFVFSFTNLRIHDTVDKTFSYTGSLYCDSHYNSIAQSWTNRYEGETEIYEGRWGSVFDDSGSVYWDDNYLEVDESGNTNVYVARYLPNCDFKNITVMEGAKNHTILDVQYVTESSGSGYNITGYTRSEKLEKVRNKEVFFRRVYTEELGWVLEIYSLFDVNAGVRLSGQGEYSINVYASTIPTYYWALRENVGDVIFQEVDQYSEFEWVYLDETTDKISANSNRYNWNSMWDIDNDGFTEVITSPWVISRFYSNSQWNRILRFEDWTVVAQGPRSGPISGYNTGFEVYDGEVWYQDTNLDGHNELFALDDDNDGVLDAEDNCQAVANLSQLDTDNDSLGNACDKDDDGDGVLDSQDTFPLDNTETSDSDLDGVGDNSDWAPNDSSESVDTDGDGVGDNADAFPTDATETLDTDGDGDGDNTDVDIDGDGLLNGDDPFPMQGQYTADSDSDGMPDAWETRYGLDPNDASDATSDQDNDGVSALDEFLAGTIPSGSLDIDGNAQYDALTDGLLLLRGMFGLDGDALVTGTVASDAAYTASVDIESRIATLGDLADIDGNGEIDALTDGLLTLRYLFGLEGDTLINGVVASDATRTSAEQIEAHLKTLMPAL